MVEKIELPLLFKCPIGQETWPMDSIKSSIDSLPRARRQTLHTVHFWCPALHGFNLAQAIREGVFTKEQGQQVLAYAQESYHGFLRQWGIQEDSHGGAGGQPGQG